jgi:hypothetical protein
MDLGKKNSPRTRGNTAAYKLQNKQMAENSTLRKDQWASILDHDKELATRKFLSFFLTFYHLLELVGGTSTKLHESLYQFREKS